MAIRILARSLVAAAAAALTLVASPAPASPRPSDPGVAKVHSGWLRGSTGAQHVTYAGIPYAAPPVGELRWRPPAEPRPWQGVRDAATPGPPCPQRGPAGDAGAEDCLHLGVTVPRDRRAGERLPVLVWLHGGGFVSGAAQEYDGARLAAAGRLMVVTVNYRLGALGFLAAPGLDGAGNYGLMDQAAALRWVRRNAAAFGGDPRNVTLAGQSAGARAVCAQLASPAARGLFHRAIAQSGACDNRVPTLDEALAFGARATGELGCAGAADVAGCLRGRTPAQLLAVLPGAGRDVHGRAADRPWNPVAGTPVLPRQPADALRTGSAARVPLLIGGTRDEMRAFVSGENPVTEQRYRQMMAETFGRHADAVLAQYPVREHGSPALALAAVLTDWGGFVGACPVLRTAEAAAPHQPVYAYEFAEDSGQSTDGFPMGSYHGLDLPYLWDLRTAWAPYPPLTAEQRELSATMVEHWSRFARTGRAPWPEFGTAGTVVALSTRDTGPTPFAAAHRCGFWAGLPR